MIGHSRLMLALAFACAGHACAGAALHPQAAKTETPSIGAEAPTIEELKNTTYAGIDERLGAVTLANGRWAGAPVVPSAASQPIVELAEGFRVVGDLDGDRQDEAVVVLTYRSGGTGTLSFLAVVTRKDGILRNVATQRSGTVCKSGQPASIAHASFSAP